MTRVGNFSPLLVLSFSKEILLNFFPLAGTCCHVILFKFNKHLYYHRDLNLELKLVNRVKYTSLYFGI